VYYEDFTLGPIVASVSKMLKIKGVLLAGRLHMWQAMRREEYGDAFAAGYGATRRFLLAHGAPIEDAEEIAQAAWVRGWEYRDQLRDSKMVNFWVNSIARNLFRARFRGPVKVPIEGLNPCYSMDMGALELRRLMERCPRRDRDLLKQTLEGYSAEEIAREVGITPTGIRVRLLRIRQSLREQTAPRQPVVAAAA
jgi:DNA-directed RNA polymerase specialized sigma24 family protein